MTRTWLRLSVLAGIILAPVAATLGDDDDTPEARMVAAARAHAKAEVALLAFRLDSSDGDTLELRSKPVLHWSNPVSGKVFGDVYVWTRDGRPEVIGSIYKWFDPFTHARIELQSLSERPLHGTFDGEAQWTPREPGVVFAAVPGKPRPAARPVARLVQMKRVAKEFTAEAVDRNDENSTWNLRLLGQPLIRYSSPAREGRPEVVDGAIFAFVQDTTSDPEVLLLVELRRTDAGPEWQYALCRQNSLRFRVSHEGTRVWDVARLAPPWENVQNPESPYRILVGSDQ